MCQFEKFHDGGTDDDMLLVDWSPKVQRHPGRLSVEGPVDAGQYN